LQDSHLPINGFSFDLHKFQNVYVLGGGKAGIEGTCRMMAIAEKAKEDDLVICLISGCGSSLVPLLREGLSLSDKQELTNTSLKSGATISEINAVRKYLFAFKGGWLARKAYPATVLNLNLSDVVGDPLDSIASEPTVPDLSTFKDAGNVLEKYVCGQMFPPVFAKS
jgi:hydroxypyruvate reductase